MNTPSGWNICLLLALLCAGSLVPTLVRAAPPGSSEASAKASVVESIQCEGLQHVQESAVRDRLALKPGGAFTMERMEEEGIVGQPNHSGKREILVAEEESRF